MNCLLKPKCQPSSEEYNKIKILSLYNTIFTMPGKQAKIIETRKCEVYCKEETSNRGHIQGKSDVGMIR